MDEALQEAIRRAGGVVALARALGVSHQAVSQWKQAPPRQAAAIERVTGVSRSALRPDSYPPDERVSYSPSR
jgi:DNA-binding transcriptional regulator YdaS (Cro superfamily)